MPTKRLRICWRLKSSLLAPQSRERLLLSPSLRVQKGLGRGDFPGITEKEVARLERGEVKKPHAGTLEALAERLGVAPDEIATY